MIELVLAALLGAVLGIGVAVFLQRAFGMVKTVVKKTAKYHHISTIETYVICVFLVAGGVLGVMYHKGLLW